MDNRLKKIIAREGLIFLAFTILSCLSIFVISNIPDSKAYKITTSKPTAPASKAEPIDESKVVWDATPRFTTMPSIDKSEPIRESDVVWDDTPSKPKDIFDKIHAEQMAQLNADKPSVSAAYDYKTKIKQAGTYIILLGYPAYLLISFVTWAIKTLKQK